VGRRRRRGSGRENKWARVFGGGNGDGVLFPRNRRVAVDLDRVAAVVPSVTGPLLAQAGTGMRGPGPGCLGPSASARAGVRGGVAGRPLAGRARVSARDEPGFPAGPRASEWAG
jgi:hypothetical protein